MDADRLAIACRGEPARLLAVQRLGSQTRVDASQDPQIRASQRRNCLPDHIPVSQRRAAWMMGNPCRVEGGDTADTEAYRVDME
jgi:hypothetical protein